MQELQRLKPGKCYKISDKKQARVLCGVHLSHTKQDVWVVEVLTQKDNKVSWKLDSWLQDHQYKTEKITQEQWNEFGTGTST